MSIDNEDKVLIGTGAAGGVVATVGTVLQGVAGVLGATAAGEVATGVLAPVGGVTGAVAGLLGAGGTALQAIGGLSVAGAVFGGVQKMQRNAAQEDAKIKIENKIKKIKKMRKNLKS